MANQDVLSGHLQYLAALEAGLSSVPAHSKLEKAWDVTMQRFEFSPEGVSLRGDRPSFGTYADNPLLAFSAILKEGLYPPPELMLWLCAVFHEYFEAGGRKGIEEGFFGEIRKSRGGGIFAHRISRDRDLARLIQDLEDLIFTDPSVHSIRSALEVARPECSSKVIDSLLHRLRVLGLNQENWIDVLRPELPRSF